MYIYKNSEVTNMKSLVRKLSGILALAFLLTFTFNTQVKAEGDWDWAFGFSDTVMDIKAGDYKEIELYARFDYTYYISEHTSKKTYIDCDFREGTKKIKVHIGEDEQVKNITFYFYATYNDNNYRYIDVRVKDIKTGFTVPGAEALKTYAGNNAEFNAYYYFVNYPDLQAAFGINGDALLNHWNSFGKSEKRVANKIK